MSTSPSLSKSANAAPRAGLRCRRRRAELLADVGESPVAQVAIDDLALFVTGLGLEPADLGVDVAVDEKQIEPAVAVEIEKTDTPAEPACIETETGGKGPVFAQALAGVRVERRGVAGEVRLEDVHRPVAVVVSDREPHPGLRLPVLTVGASGARGDVGERAVPVVAIERARVRVVGDVDVHPPVIVEVERCHAETVGAAGARDARGSDTSANVPSPRLR